MSYLQVNVTLTRQGGSALPNAITTLERLAAISPGGFFFLRKQPDLRARLAVSAANAAACRAQVTQALCALVDARAVERWGESVYEPEARRFGGPHAMAHVHQWFAADSAAFVHLARRARGLSDEVFSLVVLEDLFRQATSDEGEAWDVWANIKDRLTDDEDNGADFTFRKGLFDTIAQQGTAAEGDALEAYRSANGALARGLVEVGNTAQLTTGVRALLPFVALHHWNRYAISLSARGRLTRMMARMLDPHCGLRGAVTP